MKKLSSLILITAAGLSLTACQQQSSSTAGFTDAQKADIGKIASDYIVKNPEVLVQASQALQAKQQKAKSAQAVKTVIANAKDLLKNPKSPNIGNPASKVALIEFYDYQCAYCHKEAPIVEGVLEANSNVLYIGKQFPIFASRWPGSKLAAELAFVAQEQGKFKAYHDGIFDSGLDEGKLTKADILSIAKKAGMTVPDFDTNKTEMTQVTDDVQADFNLAVKIGFQGTPGLIVMPNTTNPSALNADNVSVFFGFTSKQQLEAAIKKAAQ